MKNPCTLAGLTVAALLLGPWAMGERFGHSIGMEKLASGNFYVHGSLSDTAPADFLVDTGSGFVSITAALFTTIRRLPGTQYLREIRGTMANGTTQRVKIYRVAKLALADACVLHDIEVAVMPGANRNILGLSALRHVAPFALELNPPRLLLSDCTLG